MVNNIHSNQAKAPAQVSNNDNLPKVRSGDVQSVSFMLNMHQALTAAEGPPKDLDGGKDWEKYFNGTGTTQEKGSGDSLQKLEAQYNELMKQLKDPKLSPSERVTLCTVKMLPILGSITEARQDAQIKQQGEKLSKLHKELTNPNLSYEQQYKIREEINQLNTSDPGTLDLDKLPNSKQLQELENEISKEVKKILGEKS